MAVADNPAAALAEAFETLALVRSLLLVEAAIELGAPSAIAQVWLEPEQLLEVASVTAPPILYMTTLPFCRAAVEAEVADELGVTVSTLPAALKRQLAALTRYEDEICRVRVQFVVSGVLHWTHASAPWLEAFDAALETAVEQQRDAQLADRSAAGQAHHAQVDSLARKLAAESAFGYGQVSAAKRLFLAETMFVNVPRELLGEVVERATHIHWLAQSGFGGAER